jgi:hypothetical protein
MVHTLRSSVHDNFWGKGEENVLEQAKSKSEAGPVMPVLHNLQAVPIEVDVAIEIHRIKCLQWNLVRPSVLELVGLMFECKIMFDRAARIFGFFVFARREGRGEVPEGDQDRDRGEDAEKDGGLQSTTQLP